MQTPFSGAHTRPLGKTGERLSALGFGCMGLVGWYGTRNDAESRATLLGAIDRGITHFDTASSYQLGENERFVGATLGERRNGVFLASKFGITRTPDGTIVLDNRPAALRKAVAESLERLGTDRRNGRWVVPETLTVTAMAGEMEVDFTQAILQARRVLLYATAIGGRIRLIVPDGVSVVVTGHVVLGRKRGRTPPPASPDTPVIEVRALVIAGELAIRTPPKSRRFRLLRRS